MISNLDLIESVDLKNNLLQLRLNLIDMLSDPNLNWGHKDTEHKVNNFLYRNVIGVGYPISICQGGCWYEKDSYVIEFSVDYKVTYGYAPYQSLDAPISLKFRVNKSTIRDRKLDKIGI